MNLDQARANMISQQLRTWNVMDERTLKLMQQVHRELFVADEYKNLAFSDTEIPVGHGQCMMPPREEGHILQSLKIQPHETVLQIGALGGYLTALFAQQGKHVYVVEPFQELLMSAQQRVSAIGLTNVSYIQGDINTGWQTNGPFDVIVLTGSVPAVSQSLHESLAIKGRLYAVVGNPPAMTAMVFHHEDEGTWRETKLFETNRPRLPHVEEPNTFVF